MMNKRNLYFDYFVLPPSNFVDPVNGNFPSISSLMDSGRCAQYLPPHIFSYFHIFYSYFHIFISCCTPAHKKTPKIFSSKKRNSPSFEKMELLQVSRRVVETSHVVKFFCSFSTVFTLSASFGAPISDLSNFYISLLGALCSDF